MVRTHLEEGTRSTRQCYPATSRFESNGGSVHLEIQGGISTQKLMQEAITAHRHNDWATAEKRYREVLRRSPAHPDATHFLGLLAHQAGHDEAALKLLRRAIELNPGSDLYRLNLGGVLQALGRYREAEHCYSEALRLKHDHVGARMGLAQVKVLQNRLEEALADYEHVLALEPGNFEARMGQGSVLMELTRRTEALACYRKAHALCALDADKLQRLGRAYLDLDAADAARSCFESALAIRPDDAEAHNSLGIALGELGDLKGAEACYREALRISPDYAGAYHNLVGITRLIPSDPLWKPLMRLSDDIQSRPTGDAILLHFSLGKVWEAAGEYERAFLHFLAGNRLKRAGLNYDEARQTNFFHDSIRYFDSAFLAARAGAGNADELPIFIIGMPRAGTTLVEQILASHPLVYGGGELHLLRQCLRVELGPVESEDELPARLTRLTDNDIKRAGERYLAATRELAPGAVRVTDKLPGNMVLVGLIHMMFPRARIVHCMRDAMDTCLSCFSQHFSTGYHFSYELGELGRFYRAYAELMCHWHTVLPTGRMLEVRYEDVVADLPGQARKLVGFCGLPWDEACLRFYASSRPVKTASLAQVRQPIYSSSVGRWKRYARYLEPLRHAMEGGKSVHE